MQKDKNKKVVGAEALNYSSEVQHHGEISDFTF